MAGTLQSFRELLDGTELRARTIVSIPVPDSVQAGFAVQIEAAELLPAWEIGRDLVEKSQRWPVVVASWTRGKSSWASAFESNNLFNRFPYSHGSKSLHMSPDAIIRRAGDVDAALVLDTLIQGNPNLVEEPDDELSTDGEHLKWFTPPGLPLALLFLPTASGSDALAYVHYYGATARDSANFVAILRRWRAHWGAELVAHYGTVLQFVVERPPRSFQAAYSLAREQIVVAPCTTALQGISVKAHAAALVGRATWFLHERP